MWTLLKALAFSLKSKCQQKNCVISSEARYLGRCEQASLDVAMNVTPGQSGSKTRYVYTRAVLLHPHLPKQ